MKYFVILLLSFLAHSILAQEDVDGWISAQLGEISWQKTYEGVLADYHPVTLYFASDKKEIAGYLMHKGDQKKHRLIGEWTDSRLFQLQERDENGRLTGYLTGKIKDDQLDLKWISVQQDRMFEIKAATDQIVKIGSKKPSAEWIEIPADPAIIISVQKIGNGLVDGFVMADEHYIRFDGVCMDGSCSIWKASWIDLNGRKENLQMQQKAPMAYKAGLNNQSFNATVAYAYPLAIRQIDHSSGFIDFTYPKVEDQTYTNWIKAFWEADSVRLMEAAYMELAPRLAYRSSGWIEILGQSESYISGVFTFINPMGSHREAFLLLRKEEQMINPMELLNTPDDFSKGAEIALSTLQDAHDEVMSTWLEGVGYEAMVPTSNGIIMATEFSTIYGDELQLLSIPESKSLIKKKYWKYFGW
jgi:hypothetical protein